MFIVDLDSGLYNSHMQTSEALRFQLYARSYATTRIFSIAPYGEGLEQMRVREDAFLSLLLSYLIASKDAGSETSRQRVPQLELA